MSCYDSQTPVTKDLEDVVKKMVEDSIDSVFNENAAFLNESIRLNMQDSLNDTIQNIDRKIFHLRTDLKKNYSGRR